MRRFVISVAAIGIAALAGCGSSPKAASPEAASILNQARTPAAVLTQRHRATLPAGTAVYTPHLIGVRTADGLETFPASARVGRTAEHVTVTVDGKTSAFPVQATIEDVTGSVEYYVYPGRPVPEALRGMVPTAVVRKAQS